MGNNYKSIFITIGIILVVCLFLTKHFSWKNVNEQGNITTIESDGKGYYMYLPNIFITKNIAHQKPDNRYILKTENGSINKYYVGTAITIFPFFSIGYLSAYILKEPLDGYSRPFQKAINFAALFYLGLGLFFFSSLLLLYQIKTSIICITTTIIVFGTNLMIYSIIHPSFSHIYSFCFISLFFFSTKKLVITQNFKYAILTTFAFAMIVIIRPINGLIILTLPFIAGSFAVMKSTIINLINYKKLLSISIVIACIISIQLYIWYIQTGSIINWSYQNEGFYFTNPQILNVLFSFRKGLFIYTPITLLSMFGLVIIYKKNKLQFYSISLFLIILIYLTASWWCWYYGPSFGQRPFVEFYAIFGLFLALLINHFNKTKLGYLIIILATLLSLFNLIQSYQYTKHIISSWDMDYEKYKYVFLQTSEKYSWNIGGCNDIKPYHKKETLLLNINNDFDSLNNFEKNHSLKNLANNHHQVSDYTNKEFNGKIEIQSNDTIIKYRVLFAEIELDRLEVEASEKQSPILVINIVDSIDSSYYYYSFPINNIPNSIQNEWKTIKYSVEIPKINAIGDNIRCYIWNKNLNPFYIDNFKFKLWGLD